MLTTACERSEQEGHKAPALRGVQPPRFPKVRLQRPLLIADSQRCRMQVVALIQLWSEVLGIKHDGWTPQSQLQHKN